VNLVGLWPIIQNDCNLKRCRGNPQGLQLKLNKIQTRAKNRYDKTRNT
jgi:hypothetical protein